MAFGINGDHAVQVAELSLLVKWEGSNAALQPMLLMAHIDVVTLQRHSLLILDMLHIRSVIYLSTLMMRH